VCCCRSAYPLPPPLAFPAAAAAAARELAARDAELAEVATAQQQQLDQLAQRHAKQSRQWVRGGPGTDNSNAPIVCRQAAACVDCCVGVQLRRL
jgi:NAD(P)H-hydrate repair Nnr-like enzyme with NAD(P)H-hydrate epimerase domain